MDADPEAALQTAQATLRWSLRHGGPDSALTVNAKREVAELLERSGRFDEALQLRSEIATSLRLQLGVDDPSTLMAEGLQGSVLERLGRHAEALPHFEHVVAVRTKTLGRDDMSTLLAMGRLGCVHRSLGNLQESRQLLQEAVDRYQSQGAGETEDSMKTTSHLATTLFQLEQVSEACDLRKHIVEVRNRTLGPNDPATLSSAQSLAAMLRWIGEPHTSMAIDQSLPDTSLGEDRADTSGPASDDLDRIMDRRLGPSKEGLVDLLSGRPGWRLETSLTPGAPPIWCFRSGGKIEFSVVVEGSSLRLFVRDTGAEIVFSHTDELTTWLGTNRPAALQDPSSAPTLRSRFRNFVEWS
jgi:tetratricopeptide (TPR) repeat protein